MTIHKSGWECHVIRLLEQQRARDGKRRTIGSYQVYHDGVLQVGPGLSGALAECGGPGANYPAGNARRIAPGRYPLFTQDGQKYVTWGYHASDRPGIRPKPGIELMETGQRSEILLHPGIGFLASVGCLLPCASLSHANELIDYAASRQRIILLIRDLMSYAGQSFPSRNGQRIPNAFAVIEGEPALTSTGPNI